MKIIVSPPRDNFKYLLVHRQVAQKISGLMNFRFTGRLLKRCMVEGTFVLPAGHTKDV